MRYFKSPKDPTWSWNYAQLLLLLLAFGLAVQLCQSEEFAERVRRDDATPTPNVSCVAHDTKFTCDCRNANQPMLLPQLVGHVYQVEISNCRSLTIKANAFGETQSLRKITFKNVDHLVLNEYAIAYPRYASNTPLIIEFRTVNFEFIASHAINGNIEEISFIGCRIDTIRPFGFTTLKDRALLFKMDNVYVKSIHPQAFKKFAVEQMDITNSIFESNVLSKAFYELEVLNMLRIENVRFKEIHSRAFSFKMVSKLIIANNYCDSVDAEWIEAYVRDNVVIRDNYFGYTSPIAFKGINVHRDYTSSERLELRLTNNTLRFPGEPRALEFSERFATNIKLLQYENEFPCKELDLTQKPPKPKIVFFHTFADDIYFQRSGVTSSNQSFIALSRLIAEDCQQPSYLLYIILGVVGLALLLILIAVLVWLYFSRKRKRRKMEIVLPEPRTYKETQIIYQIENAGLLKTDL